MIRQGGSYIVENGERRLVAAPTPDHPEGNAPRDAAGNRLDRAAPEAGTGIAGAMIIGSTTPPAKSVARAMDRRALRPSTSARDEEARDEAGGDKGE